MQRRLLRLPEAEFGEGRVEFELGVRIGDEVAIPDLVVLQSLNPRMYRDVLDEPGFSVLKSYRLRNRRPR
jgi:hypothetical protein